MKKTFGFLLIVFGIICILISIMGLVKAFDNFTSMNSSGYAIGYTLGSIIFPLLLTVIGRWIFRRGKSFWKGEVSKGI